MLRFNRTELRILRYLYEKTERGEPKPYLTEMARELQTTKSVVSDNIKKLEKNNLLELEKKGPLKFYKLSEKGEAIAWAFLNPDALVDLYGKEETARSIGVESPLLRNILTEISSIDTKKQEMDVLLRKKSLGNSEYSRLISKLQRDEARLRDKFDELKPELDKAIGSMEIPHTGFARLRSFEDVLTVASVLKTTEFERDLNSLYNRIQNLKISLEGLEESYKKELIDKNEYIKRKSGYQMKLRTIVNFLDKVKELV